MERKQIRLSGRYRLITRSDFDGLVCGMLLQEANLVDTILFAHPKDMQDGTIQASDRDIIAGLPLVPGCAACFNIHVDENFEQKSDTLVYDSHQPSVARLIYSWLGGRLAFPRIDQAMLAAVDKAHSAQYSIDDILNPSGWVLLGFLMDARTGLGRFRDFRLSNYQLMMELIPFCRSHRIAEILEHPDVLERVQLYREHQEKCRLQIENSIRIEGIVGVLDLRQEETIWAGNRFLLYALFPQIAVSIHIIWGLRRQNTVFAVGRSIVNHSCTIDIGSLMETLGGGGHASAGSCQVRNDHADDVLPTIVTALQGS